MTWISWFQRPSASPVPDARSEIEFFLGKLLLFLLLFLAVLKTVLVFVPQSEAIEWQLYVGSCLLTPPLAWVLSLLTRHRQPPLWLHRAVVGGALCAMAYWGSELALSGAVRTQYVSLLLLLILPVGCEAWRPKGVPPALCQRRPLFVMGANFVALAAVIAFFDLHLVIIRPGDGAVRNWFPVFSPWLIAAIGIATGVIYMLVRRDGRMESCPATDAAADEKVAWNWPMALFLILFLVFCLVSGFRSMGPPNFGHYSAYIGAAYEASKGKSLLYDLPAQYGYLMSMTTAGFFSVFGASFSSYYYTHFFFYIAFLFLTGYTFWCILKSRAQAGGFMVAFAVINLFYTWLDPQVGPVRYWIALSICLALVRWPWRRAFFAGTLLSGVAAFWAIDTALEVVPAWLCVCVLGSGEHGLFSWGNIRRACLRVASVVSTCLLVCLAICIAEYRPGAGFPPLGRLFDFVKLRFSGIALDALLVPLVGTHYLAILMLMCGVVLLAHLVAGNRRSRLLPALAFLAVHNLALLARCVDDSHDANVLYVMRFLLIEAAVIYAILRDDMGLGTLAFRRYLALPVVLFCVMFTANAALRVPLVAEDVAAAYRDRIQPFLREAPEGQLSLLDEVQRDFHVQTDNVGVMDFLSGSLVLIDGGVANALPFNPMVLTILLPGWQSTYLAPAIERLAPDTTMVYDGGAQCSVEAMAAVLDKYDLDRVAIVEDKYLAISGRPGEDRMLRHLGIYRIIGPNSGGTQADSWRRAVFEAAEINPDSEMACGRVDSLLGGSAERRTWWEAFSAAHPGAAMPHVYRARAAETEGDTSAAIQQYEEAIERDQECFAAYDGLERCYSIDGSTVFAAYLVETLARYPAAALPHFYLGKLNASQGRYDQALVEFRTSIDKMPYNMRARWHLCEALRQKGDFAAGRDYCRMMVSFSPREALWQRGYGLFLELTGNEQEALRRCRQALALDLEDQSTYDAIDEMLRRRQGIRARVKQWKSTASAFPAAPLPFLYWGKALEESGDESAALAKYETGLSLAPEGSSAAGILSAAIQNLQSPAAPQLEQPS